MSERALDFMLIAQTRERARCLAIATDVLTRGPGFPASSEFADGYSLAAQEIAAEIQRGTMQASQATSGWYNSEAPSGLSGQNAQRSLKRGEQEK